MNAAWRRFLGLFAAMPMAVSGIAFGSAAEARTPVETAWAEAMQRGSLEALTQFAIAYPDSHYAELAYAKLANPEVVLTEASASKGLQHADSGSVSDPDFVPRSVMIV
jgi:hypothetical protein